MRAALFLLMLGFVTVTDVQAAKRFIDLNEVGAWDQLKLDNPAHHQMVQAIVDKVRREPQGNVSGWLVATYKAEDVLFSPILLATEPPKRHLQFRLDGVLYRVNVSLPDATRVARPADSTGPKRSR